MKKLNLRYIYGPVSSWRLGSSLGIDPISAREKICSFDCLYCQLGKTKNFSDKRRIFIPTDKFIKEFKSLPALKLDYITFSGTGEPTLAKNLGQMIKALRKQRCEKIAVLTNASLMDREDVLCDLLLVDFVIAKLDAGSQGIFSKVNQPMDTIKFADIINGIKRFKAKFKGRLALQIMFIKENKKYAKDIAQTAVEINPDEIQINTPLRPSFTPPLSKKDLEIVEYLFLEQCPKNTKIINVYEAERKKVTPVSKSDTLKRRGKPY